MIGYGARPPHARWPGGARIAVQFVLNYEEGGENCVLHGDAGSEQFLSELFKLSMPPYKSLIDDVHEDRLSEVWRKNPGVREHGECMSSDDPELRSFAQQLGPTFQFVDMRNPSVGFGFSWGRYGANTVVKRHGNLPIFAYERRGLMARLFGRGNVGRVVEK